MAARATPPAPRATRRTRTRARRTGPAARAAANALSGGPPTPSCSRRRVSHEGHEPDGPVIGAPQLAVGPALDEGEALGIAPRRPHQAPARRELLGERRR